MHRAANVAGSRWMSAGKKKTDVPLVHLTRAQLVVSNVVRRASRLQRVRGGTCDELRGIEAHFLSPADTAKPIACRPGPLIKTASGLGALLVRLAVWS